ncbi:hypothetical protein [Shewanella sp. Iso12]|uniref:hypothetical protein n=1 Tax=Shewanella sp. Iso12 TaxID=1826753 RepID=UPI0005EC989A|nr:hypothetical protein [Shewanella sp. Iso12]NJI84794.1 hypothetical protein [Shewanella sp. Iso12]
MDRSNFVRIGDRLLNKGAIVAVKVEQSNLSKGQVKEFSGVDGETALVSGVSCKLSVSVALANGENVSCLERRVNVEPVKFGTDSFYRAGGPSAKIMQAIFLEAGKRSAEKLVPVIAEHERVFFDYLASGEDVPAEHPEQAPA